MKCRFTDLRRKEVINVSNGCRLGYVGDVECNLAEGTISAVIVPGPCRFFGLFGRGEEYCIAWDSIRKIGDDIIIVDQPISCVPPPKRDYRKRRFPF